jgi:multisubunit Na+/H+ antiporter MnhG subunit
MPTSVTYFDPFSTANATASGVILLGAVFFVLSAFGIGRHKDEKDRLFFRAGLWGLLVGIALVISGYYILFKYD